MDKDYQNFVERMGSFEDDIDLSDEMEHRNIVTRNRSALMHFGIPGMHWGNRKSGTINNVKFTSSDGKNNTRFKMNAQVIGAASSTGKNTAELTKSINKGNFNKRMLKEAKDLSDDDLKKLTNRLNLENNYMNAKQQQSGRSSVESILSTAGTAIALASSAAVLYDAIKKAKG